MTTNELSPLEKWADDFEKKMRTDLVSRRDFNTGIGLGLGTGFIDVRRPMNNLIYFLKESIEAATNLPYMLMYRKKLADIYEDKPLGPEEIKVAKDIFRNDENHYAGPFRRALDKIVDSEGKTVENLLGINIFDLLRGKDFGIKFRDLPEVPVARIDEVLKIVRQLGFRYVRFLVPKDIFDDNHTPEEILPKVFSKLKEHDLLADPTICTWWRKDVDPKLPVFTPSQLGFIDDAGNFIPSDLAKQEIEWAEKTAGIIASDPNLSVLTGINIFNEPLGDFGLLGSGDLPYPDAQKIIISYLQIIREKIKNKFTGKSDDILISSNFAWNFNGIETDEMWEEYKKAVDALSLSSYIDHFLDSVLPNAARYKRFLQDIKRVFSEMPFILEEVSPNPGTYDFDDSEVRRRYAQSWVRTVKFWKDHNLNPAMIGHWSVKLDNHVWEVPTGLFRRYYSQSLENLVKIFNDVRHMAGFQTL